MEEGSLGGGGIKESSKKKIEAKTRKEVLCGTFEGGGLKHGALAWHHTPAAIGSIGKAGGSGHPPVDERGGD